MTINHSRLFQFFKYLVYALLAMNIYWFFAKEFAAALVQFPDGTELADLIAAYSSTIDTAAWVVLLLMFELETYVLEDHQYRRPVHSSLHTLRILCYAFIVYAFYGYIADVQFVYDVSALAQIESACALAGEQWSYAVDLGEYVLITTANCSSFTSSIELLRFGELQAIVSPDGLRDLQYLAWVDVINSAIWLIIVIVLEIDVRPQERDKYAGLAPRVSDWIKLGAYSILFLAAIYWGIKGDFVEFWDAFLWLVAFFFIEMNVVEWREEGEQEKAAEAEASATSQ